MEILAYGIEAHCFEDFRSWVIDNYKPPALVSIKGNYYSQQEVARQGKKYRDYFRDDLEILCQSPNVNKLQPYPYVDSRTVNSKTVRFHGRCEKAIRNMIPDLAKAFCNVTYGGVMKAFEKTNHLYELWNAFEEWFEKWRKRTMDKISREIAEITKNASVQVGMKKKAAPVGAVANLLKVLTKTMEQQGADIKSIAKVQYTVCLQNGIYIPDEFLRDVAVALEIEEKLM